MTPRGYGGLAATARQLPTTGSSGAPAGVGGRLLMVKARIAEWIETAADYYAAAALYERLSRLSDAELRRRGLSRARLAQDAADTRRRWRGRTQ